MVEVLQRTPTGVVLGDRLAEAELVAPELIDVEVASALRRSLLRGAMTDDDVDKAMHALIGLPIIRVSHCDLWEESRRWWQNITAYDSMYVAAATMFDATVVTVDGSLARAPITDVVIENVRVGPPPG